MASVLGIDAAWTSNAPTGIALVSNTSGAWRCVALAPSYAAFIDLAAGRPVGWAAPRIEGSEPDVRALLAAASCLLGGNDVDIVAIDMPVATTNITGRRFADNAISHRFGFAGAGTHSPSDARPGAMGRTMTEAYLAMGYPVAVSMSSPAKRALIEVYPHPALLALTGRSFRLEYKIGKAGRDTGEVLTMWKTIIEALSIHIRDIDLSIPVGLTKARMKRYEDALDALVCAWVGMSFVSGTAIAYGDETAAIWCPPGAPESPTKRRLRAPAT